MVGNEAMVSSRSIRVIEPGLGPHVNGLMRKIIIIIFSSALLVKLIPPPLVLESAQWQWNLPSN